MRNLLLASTALLLAACHQSTIQGDYQDISGDCRSTAEEKVSLNGPNAPESASRNAELVTVFSDCMAKQGWAVATPKRAKAPAGSQPAATKTAGPSNATGSTGTLTNPEKTPANPVAAPTQPVGSNPGAAPTQYQSTQPVTMPAGQPGYSIYQPAYPAPAAGTTPPAITPAPKTPQRY